ncbi:hypothetical protein TREPR_2771 [Treponema primitia ZAS-2]|uniref:Uncharacterized protein n=1 Tax=Treponema primitia (strain ATCC BAA-887 / DSM 12427 / ZAS-2) TaxID=545694 RepID=F5YQG6_TREPZ|nr:hypothetical protein [Treponema primitia]AEF85964.1 hypothetical protein TREPR_2771 [Treponema primitia ZAS-2]
MNAFAFESVVEDNTIHIPQQYHFDNRKPVLVTITIMQDDIPLIIPRKGKGQITKDNFKALRISTKNFKFDREEANER